ncbi:MAG: enoyl-CoA hydratase/isomerase family protein [Actinomycetota bacterium]
MAGGIRADRIEGVTVLTLSRPEVLNALDLDTLGALVAAIDEHGRDTGIVLTGEGRAFSSGDDLKATEGISRETFVRVIDGFQDVTRAIVRTEVPVVAAVNGIAVGGAAEIACVCDLRIGCPDSEFMFPENGIGLTISNGSTITLPELVGRRAMGMVLLGERIGADAARELGLLDQVVGETAGLIPYAVKVTAALASAGAATRLHLRLLRPPPEAVERALWVEREAALEAWDQGWPQAGIRRFLESRR